MSPVAGRRIRGGAGVRAGTPSPQSRTVANGPDAIEVLGLAHKNLPPGRLVRADTGNRLEPAARTWYRVRSWPGGSPTSTRRGSDQRRESSAVALLNRLSRPSFD